MRIAFNAVFGITAIVAPQVGLYFLYTKHGGYENPLFWLALTVDALFILYTFADDKR
jgi:hypothetical protein